MTPAAVPAVPPIIDNPIDSRTLYSQPPLVPPILAHPVDIAKTLPQRKITTREQDLIDILRKYNNLIRLDIIYMSVI